MSGRRLCCNSFVQRPTCFVERRPCVEYRPARSPKLSKELPPENWVPKIPLDQGPTDKLSQEITCATGADRIKERYRRRSPSSPLWVKSGHRSEFWITR